VEGLCVLYAYFGLNFYRVFRHHMQAANFACQNMAFVIHFVTELIWYVAIACSFICLLESRKLRSIWDHPVWTVASGVEIVGYMLKFCLKRVKRRVPAVKRLERAGLCDISGKLFHLFLSV